MDRGEVGIFWFKNTHNYPIMKFHQEYQIRAVLCVHRLSETQVLLQVTHICQYNQPDIKCMSYPHPTAKHYVEYNCRVICLMRVIQLVAEWNVQYNEYTI